MSLHLHRTKGGSKVAPLIDKGALSYLPVNTRKLTTGLTAKTCFGFNGVLPRSQANSDLEVRNEACGARLRAMPPGERGTKPVNSFSGKGTPC
jgi:hypothetical protein